MAALKGLIARPIIQFVGLYTGFVEIEKRDGKADLLDRVSLVFVPPVAFGKYEALTKFSPAQSRGFQVSLTSKMPRADLRRWDLKEGATYRIECAIDIWSQGSANSLMVEILRVASVNEAQQMSQEIDQELEQFAYAQG